MASGESNPLSALNIGSPVFTEVQNLHVHEVHADIHPHDPAHHPAVRLPASQDRSRLEERGQMYCTLDTELVGNHPSRFVQTDLNPVLWVGPCNDVILADKYIDVEYHLNPETVRTLMEENCSLESVQAALGKSLSALDWSTETIVHQRLMAFKLKVLKEEVPKFLGDVLKLIDSPRSPSQLVGLVTQAFREFGAQLRDIRLGSLEFIFQFTDEAKADAMLGSVELQGRMIGCLFKFLPQWVRVHARWEVGACLETKCGPNALCDSLPSVVWRLPVSPSPYHSDSQIKEALDVERLTHLMEPVIKRSVEGVVDTFSTAIAQLNEKLNHMYSVIIKSEHFGETFSAVARVLEKEHRLEGRTLQVKRDSGDSIGPSVQHEGKPFPSTAQTRTVVVQGLGPFTEKDFVQLYFENRRRSGGGAVTDVFYEEGSGVARVTFQDEEAVARVLEKEHLLQGSTLQVKRDSGDSIGPSVQHEGKLSPSTAQTRTVVVQGLDPSTPEDLLHLYFENPHKSGGGEVTDIQYEEGSGVARVTFQDEEGVARVLAKKHRLRGRTLQVKRDSGESIGPSVQHEGKPFPSTAQTRTVVVQGLGPSTEKDFVQLYFENRRRSGGGAVTDVFYEEGSGVARVTFQDEEAVARVLEKEHLLQGSTLQVKRDSGDSIGPSVQHEGKLSPSTAQTRTVVVQGLDPSTPEDLLHLYFENPHKSGGGEVTDIQYEEGSGVARVTFQDEEGVARVLAKKHRLRGRTLQVKRDSGDSIGPSVQHEGKPFPSTAQTRTVVVQGLGPSTEKDFVQLYFENRRRSGGGAVTDVFYEEGSGVARVTFQDEEDAKRVAERSHTLQRHKLKVHLEKQQPYADRLQLKNLPRLQTASELSDFVQGQSKCFVKTIHFGDAGDVAVITFHSPIDFKEVEAAITRRPFKGHEVKVSPVPRSSTILVRKPPVGEEGALKTYFESPKETKGLGGKVLAVNMDKNGQYALVTFSDPEVAVRVSTSQHHTFMGQPLPVSLYLECLGVSGRRLEPPPQLAPDQHVLDFSESFSDLP